MFFSISNYMSTTREQQGIIKQAIDHYFTINDNVVRSYMKLRQDVLQASLTSQDEAEKLGKATPKTMLRLAQLEFEYDKMKITYLAHLDQLSKLLSDAEAYEAEFSKSLDKEHDSLVELQGELSKDTDDLARVLKPTSEKMGRLFAAYELTVTVKLAKTRGIARRNKQNGASEHIEESQSSFTIGELEQMLSTVDDQLRSLKTVDEIDETAESKSTQTGVKSSIDIKKSLHDLLRESKAYRRLSDNTYRYDIGQSGYLDVGSSTVLLDDYEQAIMKLLEEILGLVERGAEAKERWIKNARKLETACSVLADMDEMEVD